MGRIVNLFAAMFMAMLFVCAGSGISLLHCRHMGTTSVVTLADAFKEQCSPAPLQVETSDAYCCGTDRTQPYAKTGADVLASGQCMDVHTLSLSPTTLSLRAPSHFAPPATPCPMPAPFLALSLPSKNRTTAVLPAAPRHGPPRERLALNSVLRL